MTYCVVDVGTLKMVSSAVVEVWRGAEDAGAVVVRESRSGVGAACLRGLYTLSALPEPPDAVVYCPGDGSHDPSEIAKLTQPLRDSLFDLVIGARVTGGLFRLDLDAVVATSLIRTLYGHRYSGVGEFRAICYPALVALGLRDAGHGWFVEMQVRALKIGLRVAEVPTTLRAVGKERSVAEQLRNAIGTSGKTIYQIFRHSTAR